LHLYKTGAASEQSRRQRQRRFSLAAARLQLHTKNRPHKKLCTSSLFFFFTTPELKNHHSSLFKKTKNRNDAKYQMKTNNKYWNFYEDRKNKYDILMYVFVQQRM
jgi:hypothetical protein